MSQVADELAKTRTRRESRFVLGMRVDGPTFEGAAARAASDPA